jgi:hypothetical protein
VHHWHSMRHHIGHAMPRPPKLTSRCWPWFSGNDFGMQMQLGVAAVPKYGGKTRKIRVQLQVTGRALLITDSNWWACGVFPKRATVRITLSN